MLDHIGFRVRDLSAARRFYDAAMAALGLQVIDNTENSFLIGRSAEEPIPFIWVGTDQPAFWTAEHATSASPVHVAFSAPSREAVDASITRRSRRAAATTGRLVRGDRRR